MDDHCYFPEVEELIKRLRDIQSPRAKDVLGLLSKAEKACDQGDINKAKLYEKRALEHEIR